MALLAWWILATVGWCQETSVPSFQREVVPILTKYGCNQGGCHGKLTGQNGFRLSLRGFASDWDHEWITREVNGRRINLAFPEESLLVKKPSGGVIHEGGTRFRTGSPPWRTLVQWIEAGAPGPITDEPMPTVLEVTPNKKTLAPGQSFALKVMARDRTGRTVDVTGLAQYFSNDEALLRVTSSGQVTARDCGEASLRVHFLNLVQVVQCSMPYAHSVQDEMFAERSSPVDGPIFDKLRELRLPPSGPSDDEAFIRRAYLDTLGLLPTADEVTAFARTEGVGKRAVLVDQLLARPEWVDFWTLQLSDVLQNRRERDHDVRGAKGVRSFHTWLRGRLQAGIGWDQIAREILTAAGDVREHPQIGYFITVLGEFRKVEESELPDAVAQSFLGTRIACARCHNHPLERFTQDDFYHFAAFFDRVALDRQNPQKAGTVLHVATPEELEQSRRLQESLRKLEEAQAAAKPAAEIEDGRRRVKELEQRLRDLRREPPTVEQPRTKRPLSARPLDGSHLEVPVGSDARMALTDWIIASPEFAGAMVNRLWRHFFSVGLVEPVDDLRASNPPSNPALWHLLIAEFRQSRYDLRHIMRLILTSRVYQLSAATRAENESDKRFYSHYYPRRLAAEVLIDALAAATGVPDEFPGYPTGLRAVQLPEPGVASYFLTLFGRSDRVTACACERKGEVTLPQLLHLRNGEELQRRLSEPTGRLARLLTNPDDPAVLDGLYRVTLGRAASAREHALVRETLAHGERAAVFRDVFWALLNSKEFTFNH